MDERESILGIGGVEEGSGAFDYDLNGVSLGSITIEANGSEDPLKDILDYNLESTTEIFIHFPDGRVVRYIRSDRLDRLEQIERIARDAFSDPDTQDINLYRAQALAKIFQIFEYDGATLKKDEEV